jgi:hypothetical protein
MDCQTWLKQRVDQIIAAGQLTRIEWHELFDRVWDDGESSPAEAEQMSRLLAAMNSGTVKSIR